jgi:hypothetical protein
MTIAWRFNQDAHGEWRWEVRGDAGPIARSGKKFICLRPCVADAVRHGYVITVRRTSDHRRVPAQRRRKAVVQG